MTGDERPEAADRYEPGPELWRPSAERAEATQLAAYMRDLAERGVVDAPDYEALHRWSVENLDEFWMSLWRWFGIVGDGEPSAALASREMPGARWFEGVGVSYPEHVFRDRDDAATAVLAADEAAPGNPTEISWGEMRKLVAATAGGLRSLGVERGDRVAAYLPNRFEALVGFLATASLGAIWSSCSPDFGEGSVVDRFAQIEPKVLLATASYRYGGKEFDRSEALSSILAELPSLDWVVEVPGPIEPESALATGGAERIVWDELLARGEGSELAFERVPFDHPLWVLYSSGTTGLPKAIVQGQGGILLEHLKKLHLHNDLGPEDRFLWFTTTGWMMWNFLVSGLLVGCPVVLYDGSPGHPDLGALWDLAEAAGVTCFGTSASYLTACQKAGLEPAGGRDLSRISSLGSTGSPLPPEGFEWAYEQLGPDLWLFSTSGGTDVCTSFVGAVPTEPVFRGELQGRSLGAAVESWSEDGSPLTDEVGELVITQPMPSMPLFLWGDEGGSRYRDSYFSHFPGVWRHGDWIRLTSRGTAVIYGRSDSTINRQGVRMGTSEIYRAVSSVPEVVDSVVVDLPKPETEGWIALFVVIADGLDLDDALRKRIASAVRAVCSPRHVPDEIVAISEVPRTMSGKVLEVPLKRILMGENPEAVVSRDSLANPASLDFFVARAPKGQAGEGT